MLIALVKIGRLSLLRSLYGSILMGPTVKIEVVDQGRAIGARGVEQVEQALHEGWLRTMRVSAAERKLVRRLQRTTALDAGEIEVLAIAHGRKLPLIIDDKQARHVAAALSVTFLGTAGVLLEALLREHLTLAEFEDALADLAAVIWLSPSVVATILKRAREVRQ